MREREGRLGAGLSTEARAPPPTVLETFQGDPSSLGSGRENAAKTAYLEGALPREILGLTSQRQEDPKSEIHKFVSGQNT